MDAFCYGPTLIFQISSHHTTATSSMAIGQLLHKMPQLNVYLIV
jgi:hypothetical protein